MWLGADVEDATLAFQLVQGPQSLPLWDVHTLRLHRSPEHCEALQRHFTSRMYWTRVWIIQEFVLAQMVELWCGALSAELIVFEDLFDWLEDFDD
jgi:hypothetical protein